MAKLIVVPEDKKKEFGEILDGVITQMRQDISSNEKWEEFHSNENMKAYQINVDGSSIKKVKGVATVKTKMTPKEFFDFIDGMLQLCKC
jgi:hypothetical protein